MTTNARTASASAASSTLVKIETAALVRNLALTDEIELPLVVGLVAASGHSNFPGNRMDRHFGSGFGIGCKVRERGIAVAAARSDRYPWQGIYPRSIRASLRLPALEVCG
jgi:hypothetical protein